MEWDMIYMIMFDRIKIQNITINDNELNKIISI